MRKIAILVVLYTLGLTTVAQAQNEKGSSGCTIRSAAPSTLVKEEEEITVTIYTKGCGDAVPVITLPHANEVVFTDIAVKKNRITAKAQAGPNALTGRSPIKLSFTDGSEVVSLNKVVMMVLDSQTAIVNYKVNKLAQAKDNLEKMLAETQGAVESLRGDLGKTDARVGELTKTVTARIEEVAKSRPTYEQMAEFVVDGIKPLLQEVSDMRDVIAGLKRDAALRSKFDDELALLNYSLANTQVKKGRGFLGFGGKKRLNIEVAAAADRMRENLAALNQASITSTRAGGTGQ